MEKENFTYKNNIEAFSKIFKNEGFLGFYRGYIASICGIVVYHGTSFFVFTSVKQWVKEHNPDNYKVWYIDFLCGGLSSCGQVFGYPIDIIRKRMQAQCLLLQKKKIAKISNYRELIISIWKQ
jgi:hypothetical protein